jgi:uncharacterized protein
MHFFVAAILLGFLGSFHCIGMCGPIALALPVYGKSHLEKTMAILTYNFGRVLTYSLFGLLFGTIGQGFALFGMQQKLSIFLGVFIILTLLTPQHVINKSTLLSRFHKLLDGLKNKIALQFQKKGIRSFFTIGLLNGLLPCGFVYMAIGSAVATGSTFNGMIFMAAFGLGTLPFMFTISYTSHLISISVRNTIKKIMPAMIGMVAVLLILRGLNLGVTFISPKLTEEKSTINTMPHKLIKCCPKK